jgi:hypothetical protein
MYNFKQGLMRDHMNHEGPISRRDFVKTASLAATAVTTGLGLEPMSARAPAPQPALAKPLIGIQVEVNFLQTNLVKFLDDVQTSSGVNTLMMHCVPFEASWAGLDRASNPLGNFATAHPKYYRDIKMQPKALGAGDFNLSDAFQKISDETRKRGIKIIPWMEEDNRARPQIKGFDELYEVDLYGRRTAHHPGGPCLNNPYFRNLLVAQVQDFVNSYDVDGIQRGTERQGPLGNALGAWHHGGDPGHSDPGQTSCFCEFCAAKAAKQGIDFERVKKAFLALEPFVRNGRAGKRPLDGYFVEFWRLLLRHPELLVWEEFWSESMRETQRLVSATAKAAKPGIPVGYHIWQNISFRPFYRAEQDYRTFTEYADFLKPATYDNPAGERMASFVDSVTQNIFGDMSHQQMLDFEYSVMGLKERSYAELSGRPAAPSSQPQEPGQPATSTPPGPGSPRFSSDYVYEETKRAVDAVAGSNTRITPGLGINIQEHNSTPESVRDCIEAIFRAGGTGIVLSTAYEAMGPENLSAVGATLRELKLA